MDDRYHRAARDGRLDLLKQAFSRELNLPDDDGMTPTLWSAYHGNLEALSLCCKRGGDYNKCDYLGNSCLHLAAQNGHAHCLRFLVKLGANLYTLDNYFNSALALAGNRGHTECVQYLDGVISKQKTSNPKQVQKKEAKAQKEAEARKKKYEKRLRKTEVNAKRGRKVSAHNDSGEINRKTSSSSAPNFSQSISANAPKSLFTTQKPADMSNFVISNNNRQEAKTISGVPSAQVNNVIYVQPEEMAGLTQAAPGRRAPVQNVFPEANNDNETGEERPMWFGTRAFRGNFSSANAMYSALDRFDSTEIENSGDTVLPSASKPVFGIANDEDSDVSSEEEEPDVDPLVAFLDSLHLAEYAPLFQEEKMDIETVMLCTNEDLKDMGLSLGPRKKILDGVKTRREELNAEYTTF